MLQFLVLDCAHFHELGQCYLLRLASFPILRVNQANSRLVYKLHKFIGFSAYIFFLIAVFDLFIKLTLFMQCYISIVFLLSLYQRLSQFHLDLLKQMHQQTKYSADSRLTCYLIKLEQVLYQLYNPGVLQLAEINVVEWDMLQVGAVVPQYVEYSLYFSVFSHCGQTSANEMIGVIVHTCG